MINGLAITAGSNLSFLAIIGKVQPINLARIIVTIRVKQTVNDTNKGIRSIINSFKKLHNASVIEHRIATFYSFHITLKISLNSISFKERARITLTLD